MNRAAAGDPGGASLSGETLAGGDPAGCLAGGGRMGALMRAMSWASTPLGDVGAWPQSLRTSVSICLGTSFPMMIAWGPELHMLYNDGYLPVLGTKKHPRALGQPLLECFAEIRDLLGPMFRGVMASAQPVGANDMMFPIERHGYPEETYFVFSYSPIRDESGRVGGVLTTCTETTQRVLGERRLCTLRALADEAAHAETSEDAFERAAGILDPADTPFALLYLVDAGGGAARLVATSGIPPGGPASPRAIDLREDSAAPWPLRACVSARAPLLVAGLGERLGALPGGPWPEPTTQAMVLPIVRPGQPHPYGFLVAGISPRLRLDEAYRGYLELVADHVATAVANARVREEERLQAEALAELDRAKTAFFSNVSHELRTPLTLMLGPLEDMLAGAHGEAPAQMREPLGLAQRNALRLLKLVNNLLDFSRIEAGRVDAVYEPVDLAALTADVASSFRSAVERAGIRFTVDCRPLPSPVHVDVEMWEKIVLNLLSNALKFTFGGEISVSLRPRGELVELEVRDTGTGIPPDEMPNLFKRFHRIQGVRSRTHEGSGIGLALVQDLVRLHGGEIQCESEVDRGSTFTAAIRTGTAHLPSDQLGAAREQRSGTGRAGAYVEEVLRWLPEGPPQAPAEAIAGARVLVADDNADMRDYLRRILGEHWQVEAVADGQLALEAARRQPPDLVLTDVMMPALDGFALLRELRRDERTCQVPVVMLSARAGEESRIEGLDAGADDYLIKPFSARELVARVGSQLSLARARRAAEEEQSLARRHVEAIAAELKKMVAIRDETVAQLDTILATVPVGLSFFDRDVRCVRVNRELAELNGVPVEQATGRAATEILPPELASVAEESVRRVFATRAPVGPLEISAPAPCNPAELRHWLLTYYPVADRSGEVKHVGVVVVDITRQRSSELERASLLERERLARKDADLQREHLHALFMQAPTPICILRGPQHVVELANALCCEVWGRSHEDVIGRPLPEAVPELKSQAFTELLGGVLSTGEPYVGKEVCAELGLNGERRAVYFNFVYAPLRDASNKVDGVLVIAFDVTDEVRAREEMSRAMRYNEMFAGVLAHDLRNPLGAIVSAGQLLVRRSGGDEKISGPARRILSSGQRMSRMIEQLLDFTRIRLGGGLSLDRRPVDIQDVARRVVAEVEQSEDRRFEIEARGDAAGEWDPDRLAQLISNLAGNAVQHGEPAGALRITLDALDPDEVVLSVQNEGTIPESLLPVLFDPFRGSQNGRRSTKGLGLGLFISKEIALAHGGALRVSSTMEEGTRFIVALPRRPPIDARTPRPRHRPDEEGPRNTAVLHDESGNEGGLFARSGEPGR